MEMARTHEWPQKDLKDWNFTVIGTHLALRVSTLILETKLNHKNPFLGRKEVQNSINIDLSIYEVSWKLYTSNEYQLVM